MQFRSFMLFKTLSKGEDGTVALKEPFSFLAFDKFPTEEFGYRVSLGFEEYDQEQHTIAFELRDPDGDKVANWPQYQFKGLPGGEARSLISGIKMRFYIPGKYFFHVFVDNKEIGKFSLIVKEKSRG